MDDLYAKRGVAHGKEDVHAAIQGLDKGLYVDTFCKILPDLAAGDAEWCNILHADTAGTKAILAYLYWCETGELNVWRGIVQDAIVMNLDDMACAGTRGGFVISSTIGRNKRLIPGEVLTALIEGTAAFCDRLTALDIPITLAGGETADVGDIVRTVDVGITAFARLNRAEVKHIRIQQGAMIVGLASYGKSTYESSYNSGIGSNGLTFARHEVLHPDYATAYPESYDTQLASEVTYQGTCRLTDTSELPIHSIGELLLSPTRTYLPFLNAIPAGLRPHIQGILHCTGGGQTKVLHFAEGVHIIKDNLPTPPPVFQLIQRQRGADWRELYQVFNQGVRLELYVDPAAAAELIALAQSFGIDAWVTGRVEPPNPEHRLSLTNPVTGDVYNYA
jgi:phosphoribosylformylglycinamidine cyclo-ligase